jgi:two-component system, OmpR family, sensor histidine kinase VicK
MSLYISVSHFSIVTILPAASAETTKILYGAENIIDEELRFFSKAISRIDTCMDYTRPSLAIGIESIKRSFIEAKNRGVRLRYLTEITNANISYCKELMSTVNELRHLDGIKGNFMISEREYLAPATSHEQSRPASLIIYSTVKEIVEHQQYVFETLWNKSISADKRIRELDQGISTHYETKIIEDPDEIVRQIGLLTANSNELSTCLTSGGMQYSYNHFFETKQKLLERQKQGKHKGVRYISSIDKDNAKLAKIFLDAGIHIRHVKNLPPVSFGVSDKEIAATIEKMEGGKMVQSLLLSNEPAYVSHFYSIFEELWKSGIDANDRIKDIEAGADLADIEVIQRSSRARELYLNLLRSAEKEILIVFATTSAFIRQEKMGVIRSCKEAANERNVHVRILMPADKSTEQAVQDLRQNYPEYVDIRHIEATSSTKATILLVDRKVSLVMELRDDSKQTFDEAIGLSTYSNSRSGVLSYVSIFENLWMQTELYEQVKETNERLKLHDKLREDFVNIAAHELRTPIQPIIGLAGVLSSKIDNVHERELIDIIIRNARKLESLSENILDITRIESQTLYLKKERFDLKEIISDVILDAGNRHLREEGRDDDVQLKLMDSSEVWEDALIEADKSRISQVISNLLNNAIRFTKVGTIEVGVERRGDGSILVRVRDTGIGIDADIFPRLFTKFATKSHAGIGLGLFISKSIIEAHGGAIWAENNKDSNGATFTFSLPSLR